jgi:hypothetical protein
MASRPLFAVTLVILMISTTLGTNSASALVNRSLVGEWTGTLDGDFTGYDDGASGVFARHAEFAFIVEEDGTISGSGTGWEQYSDIGGCTQGQADYVEFEISGYVDGDTAVLAFDNVEPTVYPTVYCGGGDSFTMHPFGVWQSYFEIDLKDGASVDSGAGTRMPAGYTTRPSGTDMLVIYGGGAPAECPALIITPTMPPASDPRKVASMTDSVSYRMQVAWEGTTPARVNFDVQGGSDSVRPSFVFNPANMQSSPISVLMDVATAHAEEGQYPITVDAWVIDPDTGLECHAAETANLILDVAVEPEVIVFTKRAGQVQVMPEQDDGSVIIETGTDSTATFVIGDEQASDASTTLDVGSNTEIKKYDRVDYIEKILAEKAKTADTLAWTDNDLLDYKPPSAWERIKSSIEEFAKDTTLTAAAGDATLYSCLFAPLDANTAEVCTGQSAVYISQGDLHLLHDSSSEKAIDRVNADISTSTLYDRLVRLLMTPTAVIIPNGTELAVDVEQSDGSSITRVTVLEGSAVVIDLVTEEVRLVEAGQKYSSDVSFGDTVNAKNNLETISQDSITRWWDSNDDTLDLEFDEGFIMTVLVISLVIFFGIVAAIIVGIYFVIKKIKNRKKQKEKSPQA